MFIAAVSFSSFVWGQTYQECKQLPIPNEFKESRSVGRMRQEKAAALKAGLSAANSKSVLDTFYFKYLFPALTREDHAGSAAELRLELLRDIERADPATRKYLIGVAYRGSTVILNEPLFHPAAQVNAVLILGELNQQEADGNTRAPIPAAPVTKKLAELVASEKHSEPARVTALVALERHARLRGALKGPGALTEADRKFVREVALNVLNQSEPPAERTPEAHEWVRALAIRIVKALEDPASPGDVAKSLEAIASDSKVSVDVRCAAVDGLGAVNPKTWQPDPAKLVFHMARLLVDVLSAELDQIREDLSPQGEGRGRMDLRNPYESDLGGEPDENVLADARTKDYRRRLLQRLGLLDRGLNGDVRGGNAGIVATVGSGPFENVLEALRKSTEAVNDLSSMIEELGYQLNAVRDELDEQYPDPTQRSRRGRRGRER